VVVSAVLEFRNPFWEGDNHQAFQYSFCVGFRTACHLSQAEFRDTQKIIFEQKKL
jgi:hypothetical protein